MRVLVTQVETSFPLFNIIQTDVCLNSSYCPARFMFNLQFCHSHLVPSLPRAGPLSSNRDQQVLRGHWLQR